ncbi:hypothetical protein E1B28_012971 [Marasmius oreades]|uniref:F-box domain-containing protein n=1 Tax=Marasmius oreades TaxID=181124 RepID=A0A9P7RPJ1_9AGAR|nr:uncharacterized protein E1B28_012971 [Marasmius oreades]KAG7086993.1 hypothetical protein E1B28_012971 [Marasmius oreades]
MLTTRQNLCSTSTCHLPQLAELWSSIFSHYLGNPREDENYIQNILLLSSICSHWRNITLSTPIFWNHINYAPSISFRPRHLQNHSDRIRTWLKRSGEHCPLSISLTLVSRSVPGCDLALREIISESWRWESLCVKADCVRTVWKCLLPTLSYGGGGGGGLRCLRKVEVNIGPVFGDNEDIVSFISLFKDATSLYSFHLRNVDSTIFPPLADLGPLSQLRSVSLHTLYSAEEVFRVLGHLPNVEELRVALDIGPFSSRTSPESPIVHHPELRHLSLDVAVRGDPLIISHLRDQVSTVLDTLFLPSFQTFSFTCAESHLPYWDSVDGFLRKHRDTMCGFRFVEKRADSEVWKLGLMTESHTPNGGSASAQLPVVVRSLSTVSGLRLLEMEMGRRMSMISDV